jgi:hypothetical protein
MLRRRFYQGVLLVGVLLLFAIAGSSSTPTLTAATTPQRALYEPPDGQAYFGFHMRLYNTDDPREGDTRRLPERLQDSIKVELGGKIPTILDIMTHWQDDSGNPVYFDTPGNEGGLGNIQIFHYYADPNVVPLISWNAWTGWDQESPAYHGITTKDVASGKLDDYIREYAREVKSYGQPVFIRPICTEPNGSWYYNCSPKANPALTYADFINAWHRIVDIFRQEGVANVAWVLGSVTYVLHDRDPIDPFYPGDDYVDWVGVDLYDKGPPSWMDANYNLAIAHNKPVFMAEWGVRTGDLTPTQDQQWLNDMFDYFESHPKIKAVVYFQTMDFDPAIETPAHMANHIWLYNGQVNYHPNINNWDTRLLAESGADFRHTYARRIANPRYVSELVK